MEIYLIDRKALDDNDNANGEQKCIFINLGM